MPVSGLYAQSSHIMSKIYIIWLPVTDLMFWRDIYVVFLKVKLEDLETFICLPVSWNANKKKTTKKKPKPKSSLYFVLKWYGQKFQDQCWTRPEINFDVDLKSSKQT